MVAIKNELQKFKEEVIRSVMEIHNKENGTTVRRGGNVSNSNNQQPDGDDDLPHRDANAAERVSLQTYLIHNRYLFRITGLLVFTTGNCIR